MIRASLIDITSFLEQLDCTKASPSRDTLDRLKADLEQLSATYARLATTL